MGKTEERLWTTGLSALIASIPALMIGYTFAFPSSAILDLTEDDAGLPEDYRFSISFADIFAVSLFCDNKRPRNYNNLVRNQIYAV